jgi:hypothetical protein
MIQQGVYPVTRGNYYNEKELYRRFQGEIAAYDGKGGPCQA